MITTHQLSELTKRVRYNIITSTTAAGSGHPSSSLSAVELMTTLFFGGHFKQDTTNYHNLFNDRFVLSKGHAAPLLYSLYEAAGVITHKEILTLRKFTSFLQGHPTPEAPFVDVTTGSLGQGLSVGAGMALGLQKKFKNFNSNVYVLLGDSEFAEGQNYEAMQIASHYKLGNLVAFLDVNRLGQRGETQLGWDIKTYKKRVESFGWKTVIINNGNDIDEVATAISSALVNSKRSQPLMFIAKTKKGAGVSFMENADNWHGKSIPQAQLKQALKDIGKVDFSIQGSITKPDMTIGANPKRTTNFRPAGFGEFGVVLGSDKSQKSFVLPISTREAYGHALADLAKQNPQIMALDAETSNSTYAEFVKKETPEQFIECYIAEQNMIGMALGLSKVGYVPFASSFAAFLSRAFDQIRMSQYSAATLNIVGSHAGCSIGVDGASQMALEDIAMMRSIRESVVLYPSDAVSTDKLTQTMALRKGIQYLRTSREKSPVLYNQNEKFPIGGLKLLQIIDNTLQISSQLHVSNKKIDAVIIAAGITLHEALKAQKQLEEKQIHTIVVDLYSVKPLDEKTISELAKITKHVLVVEDHYEGGGIGEAVLDSLSRSRVEGRGLSRFTHLCVRKEPRSGLSEELMRYEEIDAQAIVAFVGKK
ncbi:MAG: transketolase [bacterium]